MIPDEWEEPTPELVQEDCVGSEYCAASWHVHGCLEDVGACTEPHEHVISAEQRIQPTDWPDVPRLS